MRHGGLRARHALAPLGPVGPDDARQHETREVVVSRGLRELRGATAVDRSQFPPVPRGGSEDGGRATIRRPLDVTPQVGDDRRGAGPAQHRRPGIPDQIGARSAGRMMCRKCGRRATHRLRPRPAASSPYMAGEASRRRDRLTWDRLLEEVPGREGVSPCGDCETSVCWRASDACWRGAEPSPCARMG